MILGEMDRAFDRSYVKDWIIIMLETKYNTLGALLGIQIESHLHVLVAMLKRGWYEVHKAYQRCYAASLLGRFNASFR